ncbi:MAG: hypothetical protein ACYCUV_10090 [Phycisphaerae bacterium]
MDYAKVSGSGEIITFQPGRKKRGNCCYTGLLDMMRADQGADGTLSGNFSDTSTLFTFHGYNSRGNQTDVIAPKQNTTLMVFDGAGRKLQIQQNLRTGGSVGDPIVSTVSRQ